MFKKKSFLLVAFLMLSLFLVACGNGEDSAINNDEDNGADVVDEDHNGDIVGEVSTGGEKTDQDQLVVAIGGNPGSRDPHGSNDTPSAQIHRHVFGRLVEQGEDLNVYPGLAASWELVEGSDRVWEFSLRQGITFHNGDAFTAHDVAFTMARATKSSHVAPILGMIDPDTIEVIDDYTIQMGTVYPFAPFLAHLAHPAASILSANAIGDTAPVNTEPEQLVGTGAYQITEFMTDSHILLERWDDYQGEMPNIRLLNLQIITDTGARLTALESGSVDIILNPGPADIARILADENINTLQTQSLGIEYMGMNFNHPYLGIPEVRQAINYALQTDVIVEVSNEGTATLLTSFVPSNVFGYSANIEGYDFNLDRARELMEQAGVDGFEMEILINSGSVARAASAEIIQSQLQELNITVTIQPQEWGTYLQRLDDNEFDAFMGGWGVVTGDADYGLYPLFHSNYYPTSNRVGIASTELDTLIENARQTTVESERLALYLEAQQYLRDVAPFVLLGNSTLFVPTGLDVRNFTVMPHQGHYFGDVYFVD